MYSGRFGDNPFTIDLAEEPDLLEVAVYERGAVIKTALKFKAHKMFKCERLYDGYIYDEWFTVKKKKGQEVGEIYLKFVYVPSGRKVDFSELRYPLHFYCNYNRGDLLTKAFNKIDDLNIDEFDRNGFTPLHLCINKGQYECARVCFVF